MSRAVVFALVALLSVAAWGHSWYDHSCCNLTDCYPMGEREPVPVATPSGWRLHDGVVVPYEEARPSQDGLFHICRYGGSPDLPMVKVSGEPACLYVPSQGS